MTSEEFLKWTGLSLKEFCKEYSFTSNTVLYHFKRGYCKWPRSTKLQGTSAHPLYQTWIGIKTRCYNKKHQAYHRYGGRGITMCSEWYTSFKRFCDDIGSPTNPDMTLDRIDSDQGYYKENCRWATPLQQQHNRARDEDLCISPAKNKRNEFYLEIHRRGVKVVSEYSKDIEYLKQIRDDFLDKERELEWS